MSRAIKVIAHICAWLPLAYYIVSAFRQTLGADPQETLLHGLGMWSFYFLLGSLSITPLRRWFRWPKLINYRRMLGLYFAFYLFLHVITYLWLFLGWQWEMIGSELIKRPYLTLGIVAFVLTLPLIATSNLWAQRKLKRHWKRLHQLVYGIAILGWVHYFWQVKADLNEPLLYGFLLAALLMPRVWWKIKQNRPKLAKN